MHPTCLLIDHDDTLVSTFELRAKVVAGAITKVFGQTVDGEAYMRSTHGKSLALMGQDFSDDPARVQAFIDTYRESYYRENKLGGVNVSDGNRRRHGLPGAQNGRLVAEGDNLIELV